MKNRSQTTALGSSSTKRGRAPQVAPFGRGTRMKFSFSPKLRSDQRARQISDVRTPAKNPNARNIPTDAARLLATSSPLANASNASRSAILMICSVFDGT